MQLNAEQLDRALHMEAAYKAALSDGKSEDEAKDVAVAAGKAHRERAVLRRVGIELP